MTQPTSRRSLADFWSILRWEIRLGLRRLSTWAYFSVYFFIAFFAMLAAAGAWHDGGLNFAGGDKVLANAPLALATLFPIVWLVGLSITAAMAGNALYRDYDVGIDPLVYTTPVGKAAFLGGRFTGALSVNIVVLSGIGLGAALATVTPWVKPEKLAAFDLWAYVSPYLTFILPNVLLTAAIFFALVALTRQMLPVYVGGVVLLIGYLVTRNLLADIENRRLYALLDPFGRGAQSVTTQYWSVAEKNTQYLAFDGLVLGNRVIWIAIAAVVFAIAYRRFRFAHGGEDESAAAAQSAPEPARSPAPAVDFVARVKPSELPRVSRRFDAVGRLTQFWSVASRSFWSIVRNRYFAAILGAGLLFLAAVARQVGRIYDTPTWPVTYLIDDMLVNTIYIFVIVIVAFYSGELIWADRDAKIQQIADATPVPTSTVLLGKFAALAAMIALLFLVMIGAGILTQVIKGYHRFEIPLYFQSLFGVRYVEMLLLVVLAMAIHVFSNNKYVAHFIIVLLLVGKDFMPLLGLERNLYQYAADSGAVYSDMNGWGPYLAPFAWWNAYWIAFALLLLLVTNLFWVRGEETRLDWRARLARRRFGRPARLAATSAGAAFIGIGSFLFYNTDHLNVFRTEGEERRLTAEREKSYKRYEKAAQPRITSVSARVDLQPRRRSMAVSGEYVLRNKTAVSIDTIHLGLAEDVSIRSLTFAGGADRVLADSVHGYHMYRLARPLAPGDSTVMHFELALESRGIPNEVSNTAIVENGSFISSPRFLPTIGYWDQWELSDDDDRKKEKLPPKPRMHPPTDSAARARHYVGNDADWVQFQVTVSTDEDQTAIAPGYLQREWTDAGRRYFHYRMDAPILNFWVALSARYTVKRDTWSDPARGAGPPVDIAVYHHHAHAYNVDRMIAGVKKSLDYYTAHFGPFQHRQLRIVEFPRYASYAQSLPNTIPYSEAIGFIARIERPDDVDYPFYVTAHEVAHQWWAHQVIGADAQGSTMLSETLSQYSALMVMEKEYGSKNMRKFLAHELDAYLAARGAEQKREMPLQLVENQPYIHYRKGSLVMYALRDYIGEARVNDVLRRFLAAHRFKGPPYPTSLELVSALRAATPDSLKYLIGDLFETITLYELRTDSAVVTDAPGQPGKFQVDLWVNAKKSRADSLGTETEIAMTDWIDLGVYADPQPGEKSEDKEGIPVWMAKQRVESGAQHFTVVVDRRPSRAGIDPLHKLTDRITRDNTVSVRNRSSASAFKRKG